MIKLIVSDVDGTLIFDRENINVLNPRIFELARECAERGIIFAIATGRSYSNAKKTFLPIWQNTYFLADNGTSLFYKDQLIRKVCIPQPLVREITEYIKNVPNFGINFTTAHKMLMFKEPEWFSNRMIFHIKNACQVLDSLDEVYEEEIANISTFTSLDALDQLNDDFRERWGDQLMITKSGEGWIDFALSGKGAAVRFLMEEFDIKKDEVMVFGDNFNDIEMFTAAEHSFAMADANEVVKAKAKQVISSVEDVIENYFKTGEIGWTQRT